MQALRLIPKGLYTNPSTLALPRGALTTATNVEINRPGIIESVRGYTRFAATLGGGINRFVEYESTLLAQWGAAGFASWSGSAWTSYAGTFTPVDAASFRTSFAIVKKNLYLTTAAGIMRLSTASGIPEYSGQVKAPGFDRTNSTTIDAVGLGEGPNWLADGYDVAYRYLMFKKDGYADPVFGAVSGRFILSNSAGGARAARVRVYLPKEIQNSSSTAAYYYDKYFIQLFRSSQVITGQPVSDDLQQVYEIAITSTDVTNGYKVIDDVTDDSLRQGFLYTNPTLGGQTIAANNERPPIAYDVAQWRNRLWMGAVYGPHRLTLQIVGVLGTNGILNTDTILIDGVTYTGTTGAVGANQYFLESAGSVAQNIERTALNLCEAVNKSASNTTLYAFYAAKPDDPLTVGRIVFERRTPGGSPFNPQVGNASKTDAWQPVLPTIAAPNTQVASTAMSLPNGLMWSKEGQPDAVPLSQLLLVGAQDKYILRIIPLRERLWVFKEDGVYIVTGTDNSTFNVQLWDPTIIPVGRETICTLDNEVFLLSTQGLMSLSESGRRIRGQPIERTLLDAMAIDNLRPGMTQMQQYSYAVPYESAHKYILGYKNRNSDGQPNVFYVYQCRTDTWSTWSPTPAGRSCGLVMASDDRAYWGEYNGLAVASYAYAERKKRNASDMKEWDNSGISKTITFAVEVGSDPGAMKQFGEIVALFNTEPASAITIQTTTGLHSSTSDPITNKSNLARRTFPVASTSRCARLGVTIAHAVASESFELSGLKVKWREYDGKVGR